MTERKIDAMHRRFGVCILHKCKDCDHLISGRYHDHIYHKCELYGLTHSEATDWRLSYQACGMYNMPVDMDRVTPMIYQIRRSPKPDIPINGQVRFEI